jgi:hypothetical protein
MRDQDMILIQCHITQQPIWFSHVPDNLRSTPASVFFSARFRFNNAERRGRERKKIMLFLLIYAIFIYNLRIQFQILKDIFLCQLMNTTIGCNLSMTFAFYQHCHFLTSLKFLGCICKEHWKCTLHAKHGFQQETKTLRECVLKDLYTMLYDFASLKIGFVSALLLSCDVYRTTEMAVAGRERKYPLLTQCLQGNGFLHSRY